MSDRSAILQQSWHAFIPSTFVENQIKIKSNRRSSKRLQLLHLCSSLITMRIELHQNNHNNDSNWKASTWRKESFLMNKIVLLSSVFLPLVINLLLTRHDIRPLITITVNGHFIAISVKTVACLRCHRQRAPIRKGAEMLMVVFWWCTGNGDQCQALALVWYCVTLIVLVGTAFADSTIKISDPIYFRLVS